MASFEELMKQVESLKKENSSLRQELQDNSSHLTKLETEAGNMKDVLTHLHHSDLQDDDQGNRSQTGEMNSFNSQNENNSMLSGENNDTGVLDHNSNESGDESLQDKGWSHIQAVNNQIQKKKQQQQQQQQQQLFLTKQQHDELNTLRNKSTNNFANTINTTISGTSTPVIQTTTTTVTVDPNLNNVISTTLGSIGAFPTTGVPPKSISSGGTRDGLGSGSQKSSHNSSPTEGPTKKRAGDKELYSYLQELDQKRKALLQDIENDEHQSKWYCDQIEGLKRQADDLPITDQYNLQSDMSRRQLDYEMQRLRELMKENMGTNEDISTRHEARLQRIHMIESEMMRVQRMHKEQRIHMIKSEMMRVQRMHKEQSIGSNEQAVINCLEDLQIDRTTGLPSSSQATTPFDNSLNGGRNLTTIATQTADNNQVTQLQPQGGSLVPGVTPPQEELNYNNHNLSSLYHGSWPLERDAQTQQQNDLSLNAIANQETVSVMSFQTNNTSSTGGGRHSGTSGYVGGNGVSYTGGSGGGGGVGILSGLPAAYGQPQHQHLGTKVEMVYGLLSMLGTHDKEDMSRTLLAMSSSQDSCIAMRQSGCLPLLIQLLHGSDSDTGLLGKTRGSKAARARAAAALHNIVHSHPDDKRGRREARVLRLLEQIRAHCDDLKEAIERAVEGHDQSLLDSKADMDHHPGPAIAALMKLSFDEEHRHAICTLGGLQGIAELLQVDHEVNGNTSEQYNITMRRYACMALTNLTFGDGTNKALLCSMKPSMKGLVAQLQSPNEDLRQVAASVLRNLSWRADLASKRILREVGSVTALTVAAMEVQKESTMKSVLSALWNLSAHCSENKADVCAVDGALAFLVATLMYKSPSKTLSIIENGGGILRNISSHIAIREEYRLVLRQHGCVQILLKHLRSPSLTIVSNACGTLWNLSARCVEDQKALWELGAVSMLKNLVNSKHKMISMGSAAALKNLLNARPNLGLENDLMFGSTNKPGLHIRKQRALEAEIDPNLSETCENMESPTDSPTHAAKNSNKRHDQRNQKLQFMYPADGSHPPPQIYGQGSLTMGMLYNHHRMTSSDMSPFNGAHHHHQLSAQGMHQSSNNAGFTRPVSRSGSQDSVGSVHSDISHDRTRQMLIKSSKLLEARSGGDRSYSPHNRHHSQQHHNQHHRGNNMSKSHDPGSQMQNSQHLHRSRSGSTDRSPLQNQLEHPNRIMQMMKEVAKHSGIEGGGGDAGDNKLSSQNHIQYSLKESHSADNTPQVSRRSQNASFHEMPNKHIAPAAIAAASRLSGYGSGSSSNNTNTGSSSNSSSGGGNYNVNTTTSDTHVIKSSHTNSSKSTSSKLKHVDVSHLSRNMEKLHLSLDDQIEDERPVDFTAKYSETDSQHGVSVNSTIAGSTAAVTTSSAFANYNSNSTAFRSNHPQVNNYVGSGYNVSGSNKHEHNVLQRKIANDSQQQRHHQNVQQQQQQQKQSEKANKSNWVMDNSDMDNHDEDEHPTNFSARYMEEEEESESREELPIDYSSRYNKEKEPNHSGGSSSMNKSAQHKSQVPIKAPSSVPHYQQHLSSMDDDQVIPFCTEGTPLNFLSTATSLTDLSKINEHDGEEEHHSSENGKSEKDDMDLDASRDEVTDFASRNAEHDESHSDSLPSERNTVSTLVASSKNEETDSPKSSLNGTSIKTGSGIHSQAPSLYSYNDHSSMSASPSEKPVKYCTEGTPSSYSRRSSLSSLHESEMNDGTSSNHSKQQDLTLQAIDENDSLDISHNMTLKANNDSADNSMYHPSHHGKGNVSQHNDSGNSGHTKTVTFDNHVQETPMMFSRCSSLGSLSSFDAQSVHSSVLSDYSTSRRTSGMVSPSELPDSPSDTMPPTPKARRSPPPNPPPKLSFTPPGKPPSDSPAGTPVTVINRMRVVPNVIRREERESYNNRSNDGGNEVICTKDGQMPKTDSDTNNDVLVGHSNGLENNENDINQLPPAVLTPLFPYTGSEIVKKYHMEGSPEHSCATSLSALTFDDEPVIKKEPTLKRIPLGIDDGKSDKTESTQSPTNEKDDIEDDLETEKKTDSEESDISDISDDDGNDSPVSESEETLLLECISSAMPTAPSSSAANKKKMKKSASDNVLKDSAVGNSSSQTGASHSTSISSAMNSASGHRNIPRSNTTPAELYTLAVVAPMPASSSSQRPQNQLQQQRLSCGDNASRHVSDQRAIQYSHNDVNSNTNHGKVGGMTSSNSGHPMQHFSKYASMSSGDRNSTSASTPTSNVAPSQKVSSNVVGNTNNIHHYQTQESSYNQQQHHHHYNDHHQDVGYDSPKKYATEGTPLEFSRATSLSDLTIADHCRDQDLDSPDKTLVKNDSRSSNMSDLDLSDDGDEDLLSEVIEAAMPKSRKQLVKEAAMSAVTVKNIPLAVSVKVANAQPIDRMAEGSESNGNSNQKSFKYQHLKQGIGNQQKHTPYNVNAPALPPRMPNNYSTNDNKKEVIGALHLHQENFSTDYNLQHQQGADSIRTYAVEGTPLEFSRATSPLSELHLDDDDDDIQAKKIDVNHLKQGENERSKQQQEPKMPVNNTFSMEALRNDHFDAEHDDEDALKTYAVEDTPYNFSRKTSFSDLTIDDDDVHALLEDDPDHDGSGSLNTTGHSTTTTKSPDVTVYHNKIPYTPGAISALDSPRCYATEGTPLNFSRSDSLSSLSGDEEDEKTGAKSSTSKASSVGKKEHGDGKSEQKHKQQSLGMIPRKLGIQSPAIARLKTPNKPFKYQPSMHSTPAPKQAGNTNEGRNISDCISADDQVMNFAVEDTPACYSRNSSLSSLDSNEHEGLANQSGGSNDSDLAKNSTGGKKAAEESSSFSRHSRDSFSSLSAESLSFEPSEMESALLEECISSAMPKSLKNKKTNKDIDSNKKLTSDMKQQDTSKQQQQQQKLHEPKNLQRPQAEMLLADSQIEKKVKQDMQAEIESIREEMENIQGVETESQEIVRREENPVRTEQEENEITIHIAKKGIENIQTKRENITTTTERDINDEINVNRINNNTIVDDGLAIIGDEAAVQIDDDGEADASRLAQTFAELESQFADLGMMGSVSAADNEEVEQEQQQEDHNTQKNLCLEAEIMDDKFSLDKEFLPSHLMQLSTDSLDFTSSKGSETKSSLQNEQSEKSTDSLDMSSSKISLGREAKNVIEIINEERETAPSDKSTDSLDMGSSSKQHGSSAGGSDVIADIMKESFPDMTSSLVSNISTPDKEMKNLVAELTATIADMSAANASYDSNNKTLSPNGSGNATAVYKESEVSRNVSVKEEKDSLLEDEDGNYSDGDEVNFNITAEEEMILAENANLILSELSHMVTSQTSQTSNGDDDAFIGNEQLSLVCSSGFTDTGSDTSMTASTQPIPRSAIVSESITEDGDSIATVIHSQSYQDFDDLEDEVKIAEIPRARIVKPMTKPNQQADDESPKGIRGGKKVFKGRPPPANAARNGSPAWRSPPNPKIQVTKRMPENAAKMTTTNLMKKPGLKNISNRSNSASPARQGTSPVNVVNGLVRSASNSPRQGSPRQQIFSSPSPLPLGQRKNGIPPRSSPGPGVVSKLVFPKTLSLAQTNRQRENSTPSPKTVQKATATVKPSPPRQPLSKIATPQTKSPKPSALQQPGVSRLRQPQQPSKPQHSDDREIKKANHVIDDIKPKLLIKQGTFVKEEPSQYQLYSSDNENQNNNILNIDVEVESPQIFNKNSEEVKYKLAEKSRISSKTVPSVNVVSSSKVKASTAAAKKVISPSNRSDHGNFTVAEFDGAWEGPPEGNTNFTVCDYSGAWQEAKQRHRSGGSGSGSCGETPPIQRRSIVIDDSYDTETGVKRRSFIIDDSFDYSSGSGSEVFATSQTSNEIPVMQVETTAASSSIAKPAIASKVLSSRLPQSRLPFPGGRGKVISGSKSPASKGVGSNSSLNRSTSSGSNSSIRMMMTPKASASAFAKPVSPPRASSLAKCSGIPNRSGTPPGRSISAPGRTITPPNRKNSVETISQNSRSSTPQSRKSSVSSISSNATVPPKTAPTKKAATSKIAGLWKKDKKEKSDKTSNSSSKIKMSKSDKKKKKEEEKNMEQTQQNGMKRSGTYDKLVIMAGAPDIGNLSGNEADDSTKMPPPATAPKGKSLWRRTYTISDTQQNGDSVLSHQRLGLSSSQENLSDSAQSSQDEAMFINPNSVTGGVKKSKRRSLFRKSRSDSSESINNNNSVASSNKKEKSDSVSGLKKRFSLFRKDNNNSESKIPGSKSGGKGGIWLKKKSDVCYDVNSPNDDPVIEIPSDKSGIQDQHQENGVGCDLQTNNVKPNAAIVQPFNYKPNHLPVMPVHQMDLKDVKFVTATPSLASSSNTHTQQQRPQPPQNQQQQMQQPQQVEEERKMTKTEMLMARRRKSNMNSGSEASLESTEDGSKKGSSSYLVTTV